MKTNTGERRLIVNADDFGLSAGINRGIIHAYERGIVTSASLMVRWPGTDEAAEYARANPKLSVGLHLDLGEWVCREDQWIPRYEVVGADESPQAHFDEVRRQWDRFEDLMGRRPSHIDSHQHRHRSEPLRSIVVEICQQWSLPLREIHSQASYSGQFYGQDSKGHSYSECVSSESLIEQALRLRQPLTEISCHPAAECDFESTYRTERIIEFHTLCDPAVRAALEAQRVRLISFHDLSSEIGSSDAPGVISQS